MLYLGQESETEQTEERKRTMRIQFNTETKQYDMQRKSGKTWKVIDSGTNSAELARKYGLRPCHSDGKYTWLQK
jgi:hypothetical protein